MSETPAQQARGIIAQAASRYMAAGMGGIIVHRDALVEAIAAALAQAQQETEEARKLAAERLDVSALKDQDRLRLQAERDALRARLETVHDEKRHQYLALKAAEKRAAEVEAALRMVIDCEEQTTYPNHGLLMQLRAVLSEPVSGEAPAVHPQSGERKGQ